MIVRILMYACSQNDKNMQFKKNRLYTAPIEILVLSSNFVYWINIRNWTGNGHCIVAAFPYSSLIYGKHSDVHNKDVLFADNISSAIDTY